MGQTGGKKKSRKDARKAAMARWDRAKNRTPRE